MPADSDDDKDDSDTSDSSDSSNGQDNVILAKRIREARQAKKRGKKRTRDETTTTTTTVTVTKKVKTKSSKPRVDKTRIQTLTTGEALDKHVAKQAKNTKRLYSSGVLFTPGYTARQRKIAAAKAAESTTGQIAADKFELPGWEMFTEQIPITRKHGLCILMVLCFPHMTYSSAKRTIVAYMKTKGEATLMGFFSWVTKQAASTAGRLKNTQHITNNGAPHKYKSIEDVPDVFGRVRLNREFKQLVGMVSCLVEALYTDAHNALRVEALTEGVKSGALNLGEVECGTCMCDNQSMLGTWCTAGHFTCKDCVPRALAGRPFEHYTKPPCCRKPTADENNKTTYCGARITSGAEYLSKVVMLKQEYEARDGASKNNVVFCCGQYYTPNKAEPWFDCPTCSKRRCSKCAMSWHESKCARELGTPHGRLTVKKNFAKFRLCMHCEEPYERIEGCNHVHCISSKCKPLWPRVSSWDKIGRPACFLCGYIYNTEMYCKAWDCCRDGLKYRSNGAPAVPTNWDELVLTWQACDDFNDGSRAQADRLLVPM